MFEMALERHIYHLKEMRGSVRVVARDSNMVRLWHSCTKLSGAYDVAMALSHRDLSKWARRSTHDQWQHDDEERPHNRTWQQTESDGNPTACQYTGGNSCWSLDVTLNGKLLKHVYWGCDHTQSNQEPTHD
jgi:hypothetical protein